MSAVPSTATGSSCTVQYSAAPIRHLRLLLLTQTVIEHMWAPFCTPVPLGVKGRVHSPTYAMIKHTPDENDFTRALSASLHNAQFPARMPARASAAPAQMPQGARPVVAQMWQGCAPSRCRCGRQVRT